MTCLQCGDEAKFVSYRAKQIVSLMGSLTLSRPYYHCSTCSHGHFPWDGTLRGIPLFPELRTYLQEAFELAEPGQTHVIGGDHLAKATRPTGWKSCNLRTTFGKLVKRAGLKPWPRLFHNLRSSRETELLEEFPVHVVALWMGHDAKVSLKHYAQTTDEHFERAAGAAKSDALALQKAVQQPAAGNGRESQSESVNGDGVATCATPCDSPQLHAHAFSGEERTPIELFIAGVRGWEVDLRRFLGDGNCSSH